MTKNEAAKLRPMILAIEDNSTEQVVLRILAKNYGCDLVVAGSCIDAIDAVKKSQFALILMDWQLDGSADGLECTRLIREVDQSKERHTPIIATTANAMKGDREICLEAGMDDYLSKPFSVEAFGEMLRKWLNQKTGNIIYFPVVWRNDSHSSGENDGTHSELSSEWFK